MVAATEEKPRKEDSATPQHSVGMYLADDSFENAEDREKNDSPSVEQSNPASIIAAEAARAAVRKFLRKDKIWLATHKSAKDVMERETVAIIQSAIEKATEPLEHDCKRLAETLAEVTRIRAAYASEERVKLEAVIDEEIANNNKLRDALRKIQESNDVTVGVLAIAYHALAKVGKK